MIRTKPQPSRRPTACLLLTLTIGGCATAPSADLTGFGRAASTLQADAATTFADANRLTRSVEVDRFVRSGAIALSERRFPAAVPPEVAAKWRGALGDLARYGNLLATLTGSGRGGVQTDAFRELGVQLNAGPTAADIDPACPPASPLWRVPWSIFALRPARGTSCDGRTPTFARS